MNYAVSLGIQLLLDAVWLGWITKGFYRNQLGSLMSATVSWLPAFMFYFLYAAGFTRSGDCQGFGRLLRMKVGLQPPYFGGLPNCRVLASFFRVHRTILTL